MAILHIIEYEELAKDKNGFVIQAGIEPAVAKQNVSYTTTAESNDFNERTQFVRLLSDTDGYFVVGKGTQTATTATDTLIKADNVEFFGVKPGMRLAIVT